MFEENKARILRMFLRYHRKYNLKFLDSQRRGSFPPLPRAVVVGVRAQREKAASPAVAAAVSPVEAAAGDAVAAGAAAA